MEGKKNGSSQGPILWLFDPCSHSISVIQLHKWYLSVRNKVVSFLFKRFYLYIFRERGREGERHRCVREISVGCLLYTPNWGLVCHPGMCPNEESNQQLCSLQDEDQHAATPVRARVVFIFF